ncbi:MAG: hypothetical protein HYU34_02635 [Candidatus Omnitrophica bacterium]|nr:hypothetical protein [Candidatus Omnitrophota bacterium]
MDDNFTPREVAVLVEELCSEFRTVSEVVRPLREDMADVKERLTTLEFKVQSLDDAVRLSIPGLNKRVSRLEVKAGI